MKKLFALVLALAMLLGLAACGGSAAPTATPEPTTAPTAEPAPEPTPEPAEEPAEELAEEEADPILGVYDSETYTYTNEFLGLGFRMDGTWDVYDQAQIAELNGFVSEMLTDMELEDALKASGDFQVFYAEAEDGLVNVTIGVEDLGRLYGKVLDESAYLDIGLEVLTPEVFAEMGMDDVTMETTTATVDGQEHAAVNIHGTVEGFDVYQRLVCVKVDKYMAVITVTCLLADVSDDVLNDFYNL